MTTAIKRRRGTTSEHSTFTGLEGEITIDTTKDTVVVHDGSTAGGFPLAKENNPTFTGTVTFTGDATFGDNDKAIFGAGSDLQIYHDGSNSYVKDAGTGYLNLLGTGRVVVGHPSNGHVYLNANYGGDVELFFNNSKKLETTSTGIDVTGTVTADGLTVEGTGDLGTIGNGAFNAAAALGFQGDRAFFGYSSGQYGLIQSGANKGVAIEVNNDTLDSGTRAALFAPNGDISFYEDTGTTAKLFWDASAERLGIGTSSPSTDLHLYGSSPELRVQSTATNNGFIRFINTSGSMSVGMSGSAANQFLLYDRTNSHTAYLYAGGASGSHIWSTNNSERMRIDSSGHLRIGDSANRASLRLENTAQSGFSIGAGFYTGSTQSTIEFQDSNTTANYKVRIGCQTDDLLMFAGGTERLRITNVGRVGIGTNSPDTLLEVVGADPILTIRDTETTTAATNATLRLAESGASDTLNNYWDINHTGNSDLRFVSKIGLTTAEAMRIDNSGNVGIGTSSPAAQLDVSSATTATLRLSNTDTILTENQITGQLEFYQADVSSNPSGSGTGITGKIAMRSVPYLGGGYFGLTADMDFNVSGQAEGYASDNASLTAMTIQAGSGFVGIGTSSPAEELDINGDGSDVGIRMYDGAGASVGRIKHSGANFDISNIATSTATMTFTTGSGSGAERMRIASSGNVGIGTSSPTSTLSIHDSAGDAYITQTNSQSSQTLKIGNAYSILGTSLGSFGAIDADAGLLLGTGGTEHMRIDSGGNVLVGATSNNVGNVGFKFNSTGFARSERSGTSAQGHIAFTNANGDRGSITTNSTSTQYNTTSDYRLKENVTDITDGIERVKQLNPSRFNFIVDADKTVDGFLAHEAATVVPEAVTGEKDAIDADGNPEYQGIDQSKLVPLLTAALQEAITKIEDLEARVATLEGN